jgi:GDPmannose 4,6-dehydratase
MWLMLQQDQPSDFVIATGIGATVRDFAEVAFAHANLDWQEFVVEDERYRRPTEVDALVGDGSKAKTELKWEPKTKWDELARLMVDADLQLG